VILAKNSGQTASSFLKLLETDLGWMSRLQPLIANEAKQKTASCYPTLCLQNHVLDYIPENLDLYAPKQP
jgi:hypothetical protein